MVLRKVGKKIQLFSIYLQISKIASKNVFGLPKQINTQVIRIFNFYLTTFATRNKDSKNYEKSY